MLFPAARLGRYELRRFRGALPRLALAFVVLVPLLYGAIYLSANWDPYGKLDRLQVAVVNQDRPATIDGKEITAGDDLVDNLADDPAFDWQFVDAATADTGLRDGRYYMVLTIDPDFSASLVSGAGTDPRRATVWLRRDDANGFVIGSITARAEDSLVRQIDAAAQESYFEAVFANLRTIRSQLLSASDGAGELEKGAADANSGAAELAKGARTAHSGATTLAKGTEQAKGSSAELSTGLHQLSTASGKLTTGSRQVADGTRKLTDTVLPPLKTLEKHLPAIETDAKALSADARTVTEAVAGRTDSIATDLAATNAQIAALEKANPSLADDPQWQALKKRISSATDRSDQVAERADSIADTTKRLDTRLQSTDGLTAKVSKARTDLQALDTGAHQVADGTAALDRGLRSADEGSSALASGLAELDRGADDLAAGLSELSSGAAALADGLDSLHAGAKKLHHALADGAARIPVFSADQQDEAVQVLSSPVDVRATIDNPATFYGRGLAPMFFAIALWVFGISVFLVVRPITGRTLAGRASPLRLALTAWWPIAALAVAGGLVMVSTVWLALGLDPVHAGAFLAVTVLGALCFSTIAHFLRTALGTPGSSILLVWLILQLASAGGTYPAPVLPPFFAALGPAMPMTYLIDAFRVTISGGQWAHLLRDVTVLGIVAMVTLALTTLVVSRRRQFALKDLHPPLVAP